MQYTDNYSLRLPQGGEKVKKDDINYNSNAIDGIMADNRQISLEMYDSTQTYNEGQIRGHETSGHIKAYKCNTDNTTGVWDSTKWDETDLATEIEEAASSGGTNVVANPTGTATGNLTKLQVGEDIYAVSGGGGSSTLAGLNDVSLTTPTQGQALVYDGDDWVNSDAIGGSGAYIDTDNVIQSRISITANTDVSYTATQDCWVVFALISAANNSARAEVDGVKIHEQFASSQTLQFSSNCILKKGQTIVFWQSYTQNNGNYIVYGITYTSPNLQPIVYSTEEREIGVWSDGKPLYQKTFTQSVPPQSYVTLATGIDYAILVSASYDDGAGTISPQYIAGGVTTECYVSVNDSTHDMLLNNLHASATVSWTVTVRYTKTTDAAGSGTWTPQGVPAIHFSETEHVVGTDENGDTIYEITVTAASLTWSTGSNYSYANIDLSSITDAVDRIWDICGTVHDTTNNRTYRLPYRRITASEEIDFELQVHSSTHTPTLALFNRSSSGGGYSLTDFSMTLQYTKYSS